MSVMALTSQSLSRQTGHQVPEIYVVIAKHEAIGLNSEMIADSIGATIQEIEEVRADRIYQDILLIIKAEHSRGQVDVDLGYDELERIAVEKLVKRVEMTGPADGDFLLKVARVANQAVRRKTTGANVLDPSQAGQRVPLTLTRRTTERFNSNGTREIEHTQEMSIHGNMQNPSFSEVNDLLHVTSRPILPKAIEVKTHTVDPTVDELLGDMERRDK